MGNTFDEGANIDPKIPVEEEDSLEPKSSEVKEEDDDEACFLPSILSLSKTPLSQPLNKVLMYECIFYVLSTTQFNNHRQRKPQRKRNGEVFLQEPNRKRRKETKWKQTEQQKEWERHVKDRVKPNRPWHPFISQKSRLSWSKKIINEK